MPRERLPRWVASHLGCVAIVVRHHLRCRLVVVLVRDLQAEDVRQESQGKSPKAATIALRLEELVVEDDCAWALPIACRLRGWHYAAYFSRRRRLHGRRHHMHAIQIAHRLLADRGCQPYLRAAKAAEA